MGYTKIIQYGDITEIYEYEKNISDNRGGADRERFSHLSKTLTRKEKGRRRERAKKRVRKKWSIDRTIRNFQRLVHHNNCLASRVDFFTLTFAMDVTYEQAIRDIAHFFQRLRAACPQTISTSYISVPELTKKGRYHFHMLLYNLPSEVAEKEYFEEKNSGEGVARNLQRLFRKGFVDISATTYLSEGLAGYLCKYMAKAMGDRKAESNRGYTCSRNIQKVYSSGGNDMSEYLDIIVGDNPVLKQSEHDTVYLGRLNYKKVANYSFEQNGNGIHIR